MTSRFPLSVSAHPHARGVAPTVEVAPLDDLHDGVVRLKRRELTRLWFRMSDGATPVVTRPIAPTRAAPVTSTEIPGTDTLVCEMVRVVRATRPLSPAVADEHVSSDTGLASAEETTVPGDVDATPAAPAEVAMVVQSGTAPVAPPAVAPVETIEWRSVPAGAPVLLLSADPVLGSGRPGPILGPGMRYRITSMAGSVVGMEVLDANGDARRGYANAVDLCSIEPKIQTGELSSERGLTGRLRLTRLATTTFGLFGG